MSTRKTQKSDHLYNSLRMTPVAIIGMASIFPQARTTQQYWDNILGKIDCITDVPPSRWSIADYYDPNPAVPDKTYCKRGGFIPDVEFDPVEFGLPPNILEVTDVSQLLALVVAKEAMEDAGYTESRVFDRELTGVILGVVGISSKLFTPLMARLQYPVWEKALLSSGIQPEDTQGIIEKMKKAYVNWEENSFPGTIVNVIAGRIANRLDLGATNCVVDAACGSSLAAVKMSLMELTTGRANMMITGGVDTDNSIGTYLCFSKTPAFSKGQGVRTFDSANDGMMVGEGLGMVVLKRLADAERDGDRVYAVIKGIGSSSDGKFKSIYAPRPAGQARALRRAYDEAGFSPSTIGLVEAHGTGTPAGDPAEVESLREVFAVEGFQPGSIALGSVKSQIAHTKAAAGAASLIKAAMALHHKVLPATINVTQPNSKLELKKSPFYLNTETRPWINAPSKPPRRAAISSFGFGGTNFHLVLEEYSPDQHAPYRKNTTLQAILLYGRDYPSLLQACRDTLNLLHGESANTEFNNLAAESQRGAVETSAARLGFLAENASGAAAALTTAIDWLVGKPADESWEHPQGIYYRQQGLNVEGKVVALFPGQGSQYPNMGREAANNFPELRQAFAEMDDLFLSDGLQPLSGKVYPVPAFSPEADEKAASELQKTEHAQPAIGTFSMGLYRILVEAGFKADYFAGHSFGELTALWAAGVLDDEGYRRLAKARGKAMAPPADPGFDAGGMVAVKGNIELLLTQLKEFSEVSLANYNSNQQVVLAGPKPAVAAAADKLNGMGYSAVVLPVSAAFHTPLVGHAQAPFSAEVEQVPFSKPEKPVFSNNSGKAYPSKPDLIKKAINGHILSPVLFRDEIDQIYAQGGRVFVEIGPRNILTGLVKAILGERPHLAIPVNPNPKKDSDVQLREAVLQLRVAGLSLDGFDPYNLPAPASPARKKSAATVILNGGYYRTAKSLQAYEEGLKDKPQGLSTPAHGEPAAAIQAIVKSGNGTGNKPAGSTEPQLRQHLATPAAEQIEIKQPQTSPSQARIKMENPGTSLFFSHQKDILHIHEQYLQNQGEYARTFASLMQTGFSLLSNPAEGQGLEASVRLLESVERSMAMFHEHQKETLRVHESYLQSQAALGQALFQAAFISPAGPVTNSEPEPESQDGMVQAPLVQAVNTLPAAPDLSKETRPLPAIQMPTQVESPVAAAARPVEAAASPQARTPEPEIPAPAPGGSEVQDLKKDLLAIVSEKTGYPVEMIDPEMDMEADLGIDSIKRVEILGAVQAAYPNLPKIPPAELSELHTLEMIYTRLQSALPGGLVSEAPANTGSAGYDAPVDEPSHPMATDKVSSDGGAATAPVSALDGSTLTAALLEIVAEKTGYPQEMLDLEMDTEADLGIDSIKRVEILGAMQARFPELPRLGAERLAELKTLGQISTALNNTEGVTESPFVR